MTKRATRHDDLPSFDHRTFRWFSKWLRRYVRRHFDAVRLDRDGAQPGPGGTFAGVPDDTPIVVCSNHPGWWDPLVWMVLAAELFPGRAGYGPIDAAEIERYGILRRFGAFGVEQDSARGAATFLRVGAAVLGRPGAMLWITAEGHFADPRRRPVRLKGGLGHLVRRIPRVAVVPLAIEYPFWNERLPEALVRFGPPCLVERGARLDPADLTRRFESALEENLDALAARAVERDETHFRTLISGRRGVGGVHEAWQRVVALVRGRRFHAGHERHDEDDDRTGTARRATS